MEKDENLKQLELLQKNSTYETTGIVVADSLGVSEGFQERIGLQDDVFHVLRSSRHTKMALGGMRVTYVVQFQEAFQVFRLVSSTWTFDPPPDTLEM